MRVEFLTNYAGMPKGIVVNLESQLASSLIRKGVAQLERKVPVEVTVNPPKKGGRPKKFN